MGLVEAGKKVKFSISGLARKRGDRGQQETSQFPSAFRIFAVLLSFTIATFTIKTDRLQ